MVAQQRQGRKEGGKRAVRRAPLECQQLDRRYPGQQQLQRETERWPLAFPSRSERLGTRGCSRARAATRSRGLHSQCVGASLEMTSHKHLQFLAEYATCNVNSFSSLY